jgi:hypothetical protein
VAYVAPDSAFEEPSLKYSSPAIADSDSAIADKNYRGTFAIQSLLFKIFSSFFALYYISYTFFIGHF